MIEQLTGWKDAPNAAIISAALMGGDVFVLERVEISTPPPLTPAAQQLINTVQIVATALAPDHKEKIAKKIAEIAEKNSRGLNEAMSITATAGLSTESKLFLTLLPSIIQYQQKKATAKH